MILIEALHVYMFLTILIVAEIVAVVSLNAFGTK